MGTSERIILRSVDSFKQEDIERHLTNALDRLASTDLELFVYDTNERSICFRLGLYLQEEFPDFTVDCEYNRNHADPEYRKRLCDKELIRLRNKALRKPLKTGRDFVFVFPDIIVHRRNSSENLLVIETKKSSSIVSDKFDKRKLAVYRETFGYRFAKFLRFQAKPHRDQSIIAEEAWL